MLTQVSPRVVLAKEQATSHAPRAMHWDLGFLAILFYLMLEYARLPSMYPVLGALSLGKVSLAIAALGYFIAPKEKVAKDVVSNGLDLVIIAFLVVSLLSCCLAFYQDLAWKTFADEVRWGVVYFLIGRIVSNSWRLNVFIILLLLLNAKLAQFTTRSYFSELASGTAGSYLATTGIGTMVGGFFDNGEDLGLAMVVVWPIAGYVLLAQKRNLSRLGMLSIFILILLAILFCGSRGALVGAAVVAVAAWVRKPKISAALLMLLVLVPAVIYVLPDASKDRMRSAEDYENDKTASHRILLWKAALRMVPDYPILGVGPNNFALVRMTDYSQDDPHPTATVQHNTFVQVLTEMGSLGVICFLTLLVLFLRLNAKTRKLLQKAEAKQSYEYFLSMGLDLALVGFLAAGFFHSSLYYPHLWILLGLSVGLNTACIQKQHFSLGPPIEQARRRGPYALASS